jgi:hypothetical protein
MQNAQMAVRTRGFGSGIEMCNESNGCFAANIRRKQHSQVGVLADRNVRKA